MTSVEHELIEGGEAIERLGLSPGSSGNLSVKTADGILVTPTGTRLGGLREGGLSLVDENGIPLSGPPPSKEVPLHLAFYARGAAHQAVVHLHSPYAVAQACRAPWSDHSAIAPLTPYFVMRVGRTPLIPYARPGSPELAGHLGRVDGHFRAALLSNHGSIVAGASVAAALDAAIELEETARLMTVLNDTGRPLDDAQITDLVDHFNAIW
jgi:ribulose-5-phosphate 4-epimerase/fuculose-1-phosphate aldolase